MAATGYHLEDAVATYHLLVLLQRRPASSFNTQWAFRQLREKNGDELHHRDLSSVWTDSGILSSSVPSLSSPSSRQCHGLPSDGLRHGDIRTGEPRAHMSFPLACYRCVQGWDSDAIAEDASTWNRLCVAAQDDCSSAIKPTGIVGIDGGQVSAPRASPPRRWSTSSSSLFRSNVEQS